MFSIHEDETIEIKKSDLKNTIEITLKGNISDRSKLQELSERIIKHTNDNKCDNIMIASDKIDFFSDNNYLQRQFLPLLHVIGVKTLIIVFGDDDKMKVFYEELNNFLKKTKEFLGIKIELFPDLKSARGFIESQY